MANTSTFSNSHNSDGKAPVRPGLQSDPAGPPPLHNLPFSLLGELFKGRDDELRALAGLQGHRALVGHGGVGKTRLAVESAWRFGSPYKAALFMRAGSPESLHTGLASLAPLLDIPQLQSQPETVQAVLGWLQGNPGWLLILDSVDSPEAQQAVLEILPKLADGRVLITSRLQGWPETVVRQELGKISLEEARTFLLHRTDGKRRAAADDEALAGELAERLDGLPLALEHAGACLSQTGLSLSEYLRVWDEEKARVPDSHDETMDYPASLTTTWKTSFDRLHPAAAALLRLMALLAPEPIPEEMFETEQEVVMEAAGLLRAETGLDGDQGEIQEALAELESYSLVFREGLSLTVHRVVQEMVQSQIPLKRRKKWIEKAVKLVDGYSPVPPDDAGLWAVWNVLRPHATRIVALADQAQVAVPTARLMNHLGIYLNSRGLYAEAEALKRRALAIDEVSFGRNHPRVAAQLNNLATLLQATNRFSEAEPLMRRALAIDEDSFGSEHPQAAIDLNNLAALLRATNRISEAEPLMRRAMEIFETSCGPDHPRTRVVRENLGILQEEASQGK